MKYEIGDLYYNDNVWYFRETTKTKNQSLSWFLGIRGAFIRIIDEDKYIVYRKDFLPFIIFNLTNLDLIKLN